MNERELRRVEMRLFWITETEFWTAWREGDRNTARQAMEEIDGYRMHTRNAKLRQRAELLIAEHPELLA